MAHRGGAAHLKGLHREIQAGGGQRAAADNVPKLNGALVQPCNSEVVRSDSGELQWEFGVFTLEMLLACVWANCMDIVTRHGHNETNKVQLALLGRDAIYRNGSGHALFIVDGTESNVAEAQSAASKSKSKGPVAVGCSAEEVTCEVCCDKWAPDMIIQHMGAHILQES